MSAQPVWELVANLGDVNVADYGGFLVYRDVTGVYSPEVEMYEANEDETGGTMYRFVLDPPRFKAYNADHTAMVWRSEWYMDKIKSVADSCGYGSCWPILRGLCSKDPIKRAMSYLDIVGYFGAYEFDQSPVTLTEDEAQSRYANLPSPSTTARTCWHSGFGEACIERRLKPKTPTWKGVC